MKVVAFRGLPDHVRSEVEHGLDVDVFVSRFHDAFDAPLHVLSVELELGFGDVVVVLPCGLGVVGNLISSLPSFIYPPGRASSTWLPISLTFGRTVDTSRICCKYSHALHAKHLGSCVFISIWRPVRTASALSRLQRCCSAPNTEGDL